MKFLFSCLIILFLSSFIQISGVIDWKETEKLTWNDFQAQENDNSEYVAVTCCDIRFQENKSDKNVSFYVHAVFLKDKSWVKLTDLINTTSSDILKHEQGHFDITEIYARKLSMVYEKTSFSDSELLDGKSDILKDSILNCCAAEQKSYDVETEHYKNTRKQKEWDLKIQQELQKLDKYKSSIITVPITKE